MYISASLIPIFCILSSYRLSHAFQQPLGITPQTPLSPQPLRMQQNPRPIDSNSRETNRRAFLSEASAILPLSAALPTASSATDDEGPPAITRKAYFDVRISRSDGTFYVRDPGVDGRSPADEPFYGRLVFGLFGAARPNHVENFLRYAEVPFEADNPLPSYSRSRFDTLDVRSGLLGGGTIPGLDLGTLAGGSVLEYGGRVLPAKLWIEDASTQLPKISHNKKGLLTHRNLDLTPSFGITTLADSQSLDSTHTVFGILLQDSGGFMDKVLDLPVLTESGKVSRTEIDSNAVGGNNNEVGEALASSLFTAQRKVFRDAAKTFGDSRLDKVYDGKLLRRIEVTKVGVL